MLKRNKEPMDAAQVQPTWDMLVQLEQRLAQNTRLSKLLQPVGLAVLSLNLLLATGNFIRFLGGAAEEFFLKMPLLPALTEHLPRSGWMGVLLFSLLFIVLIPLGICGVIAVVYTALQRKTGQQVRQPLFGTPIECAKALTNKAENVYVLRRKMKTIPVYPIAGLLTAIIAVPILMALFSLLRADTPAVLEVAFGLLALLVCLFVLFWIYAGVLSGFSAINRLFYKVPSEWTLYLTYRRADAYWESIDPEEFARREAEATLRKKKKRNAKTAPEPAPEEV